jgi:hypothetical protein
VGWRWLWWFPTTTGRWKPASLRSECDKRTVRTTVRSSRSRVHCPPAAHSALYEYWTRSWTRSVILLRVNARSPPGL